ncbi:MAG: MFS transporter [Chloroflexota bacterium]
MLMQESSAARSWPAAMAARSGIHYAWVVVALTFVLLLIAAGIRGLPGVLIKPLEGEFGWDRAATSLAAALSLVVYGLAGPMSGRIVDRFGPRRLMLAGLAATTVGSLALLFLTSLWELNFWWGIVVGAGTGSLAIVLGATMANRWFQTRRGLVVGILGAGTSAGQVVFVPLLMWLTVSYGWRSAVGFAAVAVGLFLVPLVYVLMRNDPKEVGLLPYGSDGSTAGAATSGPLTSVSDAVRTLDFWLLAGTFFVCGFTSNGLIGTHLIPHAVEHGFAEYTAAWAMALMGGMNVVGTTLSGYLTDRWNPRRLLAMYYGFRAASLVMLPSVTETWGLMAFAVLFGLDYIATVPPTVMLTADRFGRRSVGSIFGWISCSHQIGGALASFGGGLSRELLGDYTLAFIVAGIFGFIAAALSTQIHTRQSVQPAVAVA